MFWKLLHDSQCVHGPAFGNKLLLMLNDSSLRPVALEMAPFAPQRSFPFCYSFNYIFQQALSGTASSVGIRCSTQGSCAIVWLHARISEELKNGSCLWKDARAQGLFCRSGSYWAISISCVCVCLCDVRVSDISLTSQHFQEDREGNKNRTAITKVIYM